MTLYLDDGDVRLHHGHVLDVLRAMPAASVDCIITSPPYYGLRDYGTGEWEGGTADCNHQADVRFRDSSGIRDTTRVSVQAEQDGKGTPYRDVCGKCGARRVDHQIGLEETPAAYLATLVTVFREARRVLADHGCAFVNLGDSYAYKPPSGTAGQWNGSSPLGANGNTAASVTARQRDTSSWLPSKNLLMMPARLAIALQDDGWILRRDIIWSKPNPMPESATDRCTSAHEYVFHLVKRPRYWYDQDAIREKVENVQPPRRLGRKEYEAAQAENGHHGARGVALATGQGTDHSAGNHFGRVFGGNTSRNARSVWEIATQPTPEAHFATYPEELVRRCLLAGCPLEVCRTCGKPRERIVEREGIVHRDTAGTKTADRHAAGLRTALAGAAKGSPTSPTIRTLGWSDCGHGLVECSDCETLIPYATQGPREETRVPGQMVAGTRAGEEQEVPGEDVRDVRSDVLWQEDAEDVRTLVRSSPSGQGRSPELLPEGEREVPHEPRIHPPLSPRPSNGNRAGEEVGAGASLRDVADPRPTTGPERARSPQERREGRQPSGELGDRDAREASRRDHLPALRLRDSRPLACPHCGSERLRDVPNYRRGVVLDPFIGSGTTARVARNHGRHAIGIDLSLEYLAIAAKRLQQLSLLTTSEAL